ncbi:MAG: response regulator [candidate division Zixibacteria bacterium]|nr:response regulator [Candidatus Tariuqbacter arcticus]
MPDSNENKIKVLVIDDEEIVRTLTSKIFDFLGHKCVTAENGSEGIELIRQHTPDLVLLDFYMPDMSGEQVLGLLMSEFLTLKVVITTGKELDDDEMDRIMKKGALGVLHKPFSIDELKSIIDELRP